MGLRPQKIGGSFMSFIKGVGKFLKKNKVLSTLGSIGSQLVPGQWGSRLGQAGKMAGTMGYGRRGRRHCGGSLRLAGGALYR